MQLALSHVTSEYDTIARTGCTQKQLSLLEAIPSRLAHLSFDDLLAEGLRIRRSYDRAAQIIRAQIEKGEDAVVMQRAMVVEYILRHTCLIFVEEVQRTLARGGGVNRRGMEAAKWLTEDAALGGHETMPFSGVADPEQLRILTDALANHCREAGSQGRLPTTTPHGWS